MSKKIFWTRLAIFSLFGCILPFMFIAWRYKIFGKITKMSLSGWGMIGLIIVFVFLFYLIKMVKKGMPYSMTTQILNGFTKVLLPLITIYILLNYMKTNIDSFLQCLLCVILCETIAIPINPMPKWLEDKRKENIETIFDKFLGKEK